MPGLMRKKSVVALVARTDVAQSLISVARIGQPSRIIHPFVIGDHAETICGAALVAGDAAAFGIAGLVPMAILGAAALGGMGQALMGVVALVALIAWFANRGHYHRRPGQWQIMREVVAASLVALLSVAGVLSLATLPMSRVGLVATALLYPVTILAVRRAVRAALEAAGLWRVRVVVVGEGEWLGQAAELLRSKGARGYEVVGELRSPVDESVTTARRWLRRHRAQLVVIAAEAAEDTTALAASMVRERVQFAVLRRPDGLPTVGCWENHLDGEGLKLVGFRNNLRRPCVRSLKIAFDVATATVALLILLPPLALIAALVALDGGPVFFAHKRLGVGGSSFRCLKFRTMVVDGDRVLQRHLQAHPAAAAEWAATHKLKHDPRVTWIGRFLRKTSLDELPQLINVVRLEMSLVGPRPIVSLEVPRYAENIAYYYEARPGITGLWQVSGRNATSYARRVELDSWYVKNWSLWQDMGIIARTIPAVLSGRGAS